MSTIDLAYKELYLNEIKMYEDFLKSTGLICLNIDLSEHYDREGLSEEQKKIIVNASSHRRLRQLIPKDTGIDSLDELAEDIEDTINDKLFFSFKQTL